MNNLTELQIVSNCFKDLRGYLEKNIQNLINQNNEISNLKTNELNEELIEFITIELSLQKHLIDYYKKLIINIDQKISSNYSVELLKERFVGLIKKILRTKYKFQNFCQERINLFNIIIKGKMINQLKMTDLNPVYEAIKVRKDSTQTEFVQLEEQIKNEFNLCPSLNVSPNETSTQDLIDDEQIQNEFNLCPSSNETSTQVNIVEKKIQDVIKTNFEFLIYLKQKSTNYLDNNLIQQFKGKLNIILQQDKEQKKEFFKLIDHCETPVPLEFDLKSNLMNNKLNITMLHPDISFRDKYLQSNYKLILNKNLPVDEKNLELERFFSNLTTFELIFKISNNLGKILIQEGVDLINFNYMEEIKPVLLKPYWSIDSNASLNKVDLFLILNYYNLMEKEKFPILIKVNFSITDTEYELTDVQNDNKEIILNQIDFKNGSLEWIIDRPIGILNAKFVLMAKDSNVVLKYYELKKKLCPESIYAYLPEKPYDKLIENIEIKSVTDEYCVSISRNQERKKKKRKLLCLEFYKNEGQKTKNRFKNRFEDIIPYDFNRVKLLSEENDYINASLISKLKNSISKDYIITQDPLESTVDDFWQMIWEQNSKIIITNSTNLEIEKESYVKFWPNEINIEKRSKKLKIDYLSKETHDQFSIQKYKITNLESNKSFNSNHFLYFDWNTRKNIPNNEEKFLSFLKTFNDYFKNLETKSPVTVHCKSALVIVCDILLYENCSNSLHDKFIERIINDIRKQRENMISHLYQFKIFINQLTGKKIFE